MKNIELSTEEVKLLIETLFRGLAYTDMYYKDGAKMERLFHKVVSQLENQGGKYYMNGEIVSKSNNSINNY